MCDTCTGGTRRSCIHRTTPPRKNPAQSRNVADQETFANAKVFALKMTLYRVLLRRDSVTYTGVPFLHVAVLTPIGSSHYQVSRAPEKHPSDSDLSLVATQDLSGSSSRMGLMKARCPLPKPGNPAAAACSSCSVRRWASGVYSRLQFKFPLKSRSFIMGTQAFQLPTI